MASLWRGLTAPIRGLWFLLREPGLRGYILIPGLIQAGLFIILAAASFFTFFQVFWSPDISPGKVAEAVLVGALLILGTILLTSVFASILAAPILERMASNVLKRRLGERFVRGEGGVGKAMLHQLGHAVVFLVAQALLLVVWILGPLAAVISAVVTAYLLCVNLIDYPMGVRGEGWGRRYSFFLRRPVLGLGFGAAVLLVQAIPFTLAATVAGACLVYADDNR